ncbi:MAG: RsmB/NOP family class I SAM-dependent RNA methyltransferase [Treponema sp.]|nr:RsmB/NOP family class I SAM-dependent RNA methyltransferase [Treponema sp.]
MKKGAEQKPRGKEGFIQYYTELYGERWTALESALMEETVHVSLSASDCRPYFMDPASVVAALCFPSSKSTRLLDMCAAPGGKTLVTSFVMENDASLVSNERSPERKNRLAKVVAESLPPEIASRVSVRLGDGATMCKRETEKFNAILLDAPCSSERHVLKDPKYLGEWTPSRIKTLSMEQWALLSSAWRLLEDGGFMLYATCAISRLENDGVLSRLVKKFPGAKILSREEVSQVFGENLESLKNHGGKILPENPGEKEISMEKIFECAEKTEYGFHILPDSSGGYGPLFFSAIKKIGTVLK